MGSHHWIPFPRTVMVTGIVAPLFSSSLPFVCFISLAVSIGGWAGVNNLSAVVSVVAVSSPLLQVPSELEGRIHHYKVDVCTLPLFWAFIFIFRSSSFHFPVVYTASRFSLVGVVLLLTWVVSTLMNHTVPSPQLFLLKVKILKDSHSYTHCILWSFMLPGVRKWSKTITHLHLQEEPHSVL